MSWKILVLLLLFAGGCRRETTTHTTSTVAETATSTPEIGITLITRSPPTAVVIQTTPTALATATPTPMPTAIIYQVEEGDTLLGIAIDHFTSVDEIRALNPDVVPELLQIGQALELPPPATPRFTGEAATPVPLEVSVLSVHLYRTPAGDLWVVGEVRNEGAYPAADVVIQVTLEGGSGQAVSGASTRVVPALLPAGSRAPFALLVTEARADGVQPAVTVADGENLLDLGTHYLALATTDVRMTANDGLVALEGVVRNEGESTAVGIIVVVTFYDAQGRVSGYAQAQLDGPLAPNSSAPFSLAAAPPGGETVAYRLLAQGFRQ